MLAVLASLIVELLVAVIELVVDLAAHGSEFAVILHGILFLIVHFALVGTLRHRPAVRSEVLGDLGSTPRHHLVLVIRHAVVAVVDVILLLHSDRTLRLTRAQVGCVGPSVESRAPTHWPGPLERRHASLLLFGQALLRHLASLSLPRSRSGRRQSVLLLAHVRIREAFSHCLGLPQSHLILGIRPELVVVVVGRWWASRVHGWLAVLVPPRCPPLADHLGWLWRARLSLVRLHVLLGVLAVAVLLVIFINQVALVGDKADYDVIVAEFSDFVEPVPQIYEGLDVAHIVDEEGADSKPVMRCSDAQELFCS